MSAQLVDLLLAEPGGGDIRRRQPTAAALDVGANSGQGFKPQLAQAADLLAVERRACPGPGGVQVRAGVGVEGAGVEFHGVSQRHWDRGGRRGHRQPALADPPQIRRELDGTGAQPSEVVEPDGRVGSGQIHLGVEIAQQPVGQAVGQGAQLLFGVFDQRTQRGLTGEHLCPTQAAHPQRHGVFGGEPAHGARQVHLAGQVVVAPMALHIDADGCATGAQELGPGQPERDQQNVLHASVKRLGHRTQQRPGGLDVQTHRQPPRIGVGIQLGVGCGQRGRRRGHLPPHLGLGYDLGVVGVLIEPRRPPSKGCPRRGQGHLLLAVVLRPGKVDVLQQNSPRHTVDAQMVNDQHQLTDRRHPQSAQHRSGGRIQPGPRFDQCLVGQLVDGLQAAARVHRPGLGHPQ